MGLVRMGLVCLLFRGLVNGLVLLLLLVYVGVGGICIHGLVIGTWMAGVLLVLLGVLLTRDVHLGYGMT